MSKIYLRDALCNVAATEAWPPADSVAVCVKMLVMCALKLVVGRWRHFFCKNSLPTEIKVVFLQHFTEGLEHLIKYSYCE